MHVPFVDLKIQYTTLKSEIDNSIQDVLNDTAFIGGKYVSKFEREFANAYNIRNCVSVANGTDAIYLALRALSIGPGDEVITTALSWISTSEVITQTGATPIFVDVESDYLTIDIEKIEEKISEKTKAIIPVHLHGHSADIVKIKKLCDKHNLYLIEDCAQSHFAEFKGQKVGTFGDIGTFSFYPGKNLGANGDGGAIITNDDNLAQRVRMIAQHGSLIKHQHVIEGVNSRLDGLQASILSVKLPHIFDWNEKRHEAAMFYNKLLKDCDDIITPNFREDCSHIFHVYCLRFKTADRNKIKSFLEDFNIQVGIHYPTPLPLLEAYDRFSHSPNDFPNAYEATNSMISLPMFPEITREQQSYVCEKLLRYFKENYA